MNAPDYAFLKKLGRILNAGQSRSVVLTGQIYDLYYLPERDDYVALLDFLIAQWQAVQDVLLVVFEVNGAVRFPQEGARDRVRDAWLRWRTGLDANALAVKHMLNGAKATRTESAAAEAFDEYLASAVGKPSVALELLRQMCLCSRVMLGKEQALPERLLILVEGADLMLPEGEITALSDADRHRVGVCHDWFSDPGFLAGDDAVVLIAESRSLLNQRIARLPQILEVQAPAPDEATRAHFAEWFARKVPHGAGPYLWGTIDDLAKLTAGLSIHALRQLLKGAAHEGRPLEQAEVVVKVEEYIQGQLGDDIVEFKKPTHSLDDVVGYTRLKTFLREEFMPRVRATGSEAFAGAAVCGPIGSGKTFIFEAVAAELDMVVLVLKNLRSQWFGQTDVIFERLRRVLEALAKVLIFVDEADTQFGGIGIESHSTERRLTGKIQAMMADPQMRGRVVWLLMTARIHLLSPDIRRPGRTGDLIVPVLDPDGEDRAAFLKWATEPALARTVTPEELAKLDQATREYAASSFAALRSELKIRAARKKSALTFDEVLATLHELLAPAIGDTRRYQALQALLNCTRRSLLPNPEVTAEERKAWEEEIRALERRGIQ